MADEKVLSLEIIRPRRRIELRDLALAVSYPQTRPSTSLHSIAPDLQARKKRPRDNPIPPENAAKPWKKPWDK